MTITYAATGEIARELGRLRVENELSQKALGEKVGVTQTRIAVIESGRHEVRFSTLASLAEALGAKLTITLDRGEEGEE